MERPTWRRYSEISSAVLGENWALVCSSGTKGLAVGQVADAVAVGVLQADLVEEGVGPGHVVGVGGQVGRDPRAGGGEPARAADDPLAEQDALHHVVAVDGVGDGLAEPLVVEGEALGQVEVEGPVPLRRPADGAEPGVLQEGIEGALGELVLGAGVGRVDVALLEGEELVGGGDELDAADVRRPEEVVVVGHEGGGEVARSYDSSL